MSTPRYTSSGYPAGMSSFQRACWEEDLDPSDAPYDEDDYDDAD